jgi:hypothetical protein
MMLQQIDKFAACPSCAMLFSCEWHPTQLTIDFVLKAKSNAVSAS